MHLYAQGKTKNETKKFTKESVTYGFCPRETSYGRSSGDAPPHPYPRLCRDSVAFFILQALRASVLYKSIKVHFGQARTK